MLRLVARAGWWLLAPGLLIPGALAALTVPVAKPSPHAPADRPAAPATAAQPGDNASLVTLHRAGLSDRVLLARVRAASCGYDTSPAALVALRRAGLSDAVIAAVIERCAAAPPPSPPRAEPLALQGRADALAPADSAHLASLAMAPGDKVGGRSAGMLCMPSGTLHLRDFVASGEDFAKAATKAMGAAGLPAGQVVLMRLEAHLCARGYGAFGRGDTRDMSGTARFVLQWRPADIAQPPRTEVVALSVDKSEAQPPPAMLDKALEILAERLKG